jgi:hypothetical protein
VKTAITRAMNRIHLRPDINEQGQSIIIVALFFFLVFLVFAALSVDGTILYLRRRQLQNMADAAALAAAEQLSKTKDEAAAYQEAMDSLAENHSRIEWYSTSLTPDPPNTNVGSGLDLSAGIQITDACDVRVALLWNDMSTYFTQFLGRDTLQVSAHAHASCGAAGGLQPIAIKRFGDERDWNFSLTNVNDASVYCDDCSTQQSLDDQGLHNATDFLRIEGSDVISQWPGWPDTPSLMYQSPSPFADLAGGYPGREYCILGSCVSPNVGTTSYSGLVNLDIRHVSAPPVEYYNGVGPGTQSNTLKDMSEYYIRRGYCCDIPEPGEQVAMYNGTSAAFSPQALQQTYAISDMVAVIVYNGHVFNSPTFEITGDDPNFKSTHPATDTVASSVLTYSLHLNAQPQPNGAIFQSGPAGLTMSVAGLEGFADWAFVPTASPVLGRNGVNERWLSLVVTPKTTTVGTATQVITGTRMFYVSAFDSELAGGSGMLRYWAGIANIGDTVNAVERDLPSVTCTPTNADQNYPFISTVKGQQAKYELQLDLWGLPTGSSNQDVTVSFTGTLPTGFEWVGPPPWTRSTDPGRHPGSKLRINLKINDTAVVNVVHQIPLTVSAPGMAQQTCTLYVLVEEAGSTVTDYVEILGYAVVQITGYYNNENPVNPGQSANSVRGRIVSELMTDPSELKYGLRARLIPWE